MRFFIRVCCTLIAIYSGTSAAADSGWYVGASAGKASSNLEADQLASFARGAVGSKAAVVPLADTTSVDDGDTTWSILVGFRLNRFLAFEATYVDLGSTEFQYAGTFRYHPFPPPHLGLVPFDAWMRGDATSSGVGLKGIGTLPLGKYFDVHANFGLFHSESEIHFIGSGTSIAFLKFSGGVEDDSQSAFYGAGAAARLGEHFKLSVDWQRYPDLGLDSEAMQESNIRSDIRADTDALTLSVIYSF